MAKKAAKKTVDVQYPGEDFEVTPGALPKFTTYDEDGNAVQISIFDVDPAHFQRLDREELLGFAKQLEDVMAIPQKKVTELENIIQERTAALQMLTDWLAEVDVQYQAVQLEIGKSYLPKGLKVVDAAFLAQSKKPVTKKPKKNQMIVPFDWEQVRTQLPKEMKKNQWYKGAEVRELVGYDGEGNFNVSVLNALLDRGVIKKKGKGKATTWSLK